jgi:general secretion pathway protein F
MSAADLALLTRQLATLCTGLPLEEALLAVSQQTEKPRVQSILIGVRSRVMEGHTLADGFGDFPQAFPGNLPCHRGGRRTVRAPRRRARAAGRLHREPRGAAPEGQHALIYPVVLSSVRSDRLGLLVYVVPKVVEVFEHRPGICRCDPRADRAQRLPARLRHLAPPGGLVPRRARFRAGCAARCRRRFHAAAALPLVGKLVRGSNTARFTRTLSILTGSAVPVLEALRIAGEVVTNLPMREAVEAAAAAGARGRADRPSLG